MAAAIAAEIAARHAQHHYAASVEAREGDSTPRDGGTEFITVQGFVLTRSDTIPETAIGYAVPIFNSRKQAVRLCPYFLDRLDFSGALRHDTNLRVVSEGHKTDIAPFIWPVDEWPANTIVNCDNLIKHYDIGSANMFLRKAEDEIQNHQHGDRTYSPGDGPFIMTARRISRSVILYDLSTAPDLDYVRWLKLAVARLSDPTPHDVEGPLLVQPTTRDKIRAYVFGLKPALDDILAHIFNGYRSA